MITFIRKVLKPPLLTLKIFLPVALLINFTNSYAQNYFADTSIYSSSIDSALNIYHRFLSPEPGLYNGNEYAYNEYYPFVINEGDPFFISKDFNEGSVFYNNVVYHNVPMLFDIINTKLIIRDPSRNYTIMLNTQKIQWFTIWGQTFTLIKQDSTANTPVHTGFYDELYKGRTSLYKKVLKTFKENTASIQGVNKYVVETDEYFIKKNDQYFRIKNKKSLLPVLNDRKKEVQQFIKKNRLNLKKNPDDSFTKIVAYYDEIYK